MLWIALGALYVVAQLWAIQSSVRSGQIVTHSKFVGPSITYHRSQQPSEFWFHIAFRLFLVNLIVVPVASVFFEKKILVLSLAGLSILLVLVVLCSWNLIEVLKSGKVRARQTEVYSKQDKPIRFWFTVLLQVFVIALLLFMSAIFAAGVSWA